MPGLQAHMVIFGASGRQEPWHPGEDSVAFWEVFLACVLGGVIGGVFALLLWGWVCDAREE